MCNSVVKSKEKYMNKYTLYIHKNIKYIQVYILQHPSTHKYDVTLVKNDQMCFPTLPTSSGTFQQVTSSTREGPTRLGVLASD